MHLLLRIYTWNLHLCIYMYGFYINAFTFMHLTFWILHLCICVYAFTLMNLADAFIQSDLQKGDKSNSSKDRREWSYDYCSTCIMWQSFNSNFWFCIWRYESSRYFRRPSVHQSGVYCALNHQFLIADLPLRPSF